MKKIFALILALAMVMGLATTAFAETVDTPANGDGSITITNATVGETYAVYKVFDLTYVEETTSSEDEETTYKVSYTYTKNSENDALYGALTGTDSPFSLVATSEANVYNVTAKDGKDGAAIAAWLKSQVNNLVQTGNNVEAESNTVVFSNLKYGYYYVTSTLGTVVTVDSTLKDAQVEDKNAAPTVVKKVWDGTDWANSNSASIGDTVKYQVTISAKKGAKNYVLHDTMDAGLTFNKDVVAIEGLTEDDYTVSFDPADSCGFEVTFTQGYLDTITTDTNVIITYSATLNKDANIGPETTTGEGENAVTTGGNENAVVLKYGAGGATTESAVKTFTYSFDLVKTEKPSDTNTASKKILSGAKFKLQTATTTGEGETAVTTYTDIQLIKINDGYRVATPAEIAAEGFTPAVIEAGNVTIKGLANGKYYLEETEAPAGYNKLTERQSVTIENGNLDATLVDGKYQSGGVEVENSTGSELPSTGGMGTTIFYVVGGLLTVGAVVLLVTKKRMSV